MEFHCLELNPNLPDLPKYRVRVRVRVRVREKVGATILTCATEFVPMAVVTSFFDYVSYVENHGDVQIICVSRNPSSLQI